MEKFLDVIVYLILAVVCFYAVTLGYEAGEAFKLMVAAQ